MFVLRRRMGLLMTFTVIKHTNQMIYKGHVTHIFVLPGKIQSHGFTYIHSICTCIRVCCILVIFKYCSVLYVDGGQGPGNIVPSRVVQMVSIKEQLYACAASEVMNRSLLKISRAKERRNPSKWNRVITKIHAPAQQSGQWETGQR